MPRGLRCHGRTEACGTNLSVPNVLRRRELKGDGMRDQPWRISVFGDELADSLEEQIAMIQAAGLAHLEVRTMWGIGVADLDGSQCERASRLLNQAGIQVSAIASPVGKTLWNDGASDDLERFGRCLSVADQLGVRLVRVFSYYVNGEYAPARDWVLRRLEALASEAERRGTVLVLENENYLYGDRPTRCRDILKTIASPALRFAFDPANFVQCGAEPIAEAWPALAPFVAHVHIKDAVKVNRAGVGPYPIEVPSDRLMESVRPAGKGMGGIPDLLNMLERERYHGFLTLEPHLSSYLSHLSRIDQFRIALNALQCLLASRGDRTDVAEWHQPA